MCQLQQINSKVAFVKYSKHIQNRYVNIQKIRLSTKSDYTTHIKVIEIMHCLTQTKL